MAERNTREAKGKGGGWVSTLSLSLIVIAAGFALGIVAGVTWEEPNLLISYLTGNTEEVDWRSDEPAPPSKASPAAAPPSVAAAPPLGAGPVVERPVPESVKPKPKPASRPTAQPAKPAPEPVRSGFSIQVGAFGDKATAQQLADSLRKSGHDVYLSRADGGGSWRVRVGPLSTREAAERTAAKLEARDKLPTWVLGEGS